MVTPGPAKGEWRWTEGIVDRGAEHLQITCGDDANAVALVGRGSARTFIVQFLSFTSELQDGVRREIGFYLTEWGGTDPWAYAIYHCGTASNVYSDVHWHYFPDGKAME